MNCYNQAQCKLYEVSLHCLWFRLPVVDRFFTLIYLPIKSSLYNIEQNSNIQARIQGRWNGWIFIPPFSKPPSFFFIFLSLKYWNNIWFLWHYYKTSPPFQILIRPCRRFSYDTKIIYVTFTCRQWSKFLQRKFFRELMLADRGKKTQKLEPAKISCPAVATESET